MKILTLVWSIGIGGTERAAVNYAVGYSQYGHDSKVLVLGEGDERLTDLIEADVDTFFLKSDGRGSEAVFASLKMWEPDIIHLHNFSDAYLPYIEKIKSPHTRVAETNVFSRPNYSEGYKAVSLSMQLSNWGYWKYTRWMQGARYIPQAVMVPYIVYEKKFVVPSKESINVFLKQQGIPEGAFVAGRLGQAHPSKWDSRIFEVVERTVQANNNLYYFFVGMPAVMVKELDKKTAFVKSRIKLIDAIKGDDNLSLYYHSLNCFTHISKIGESFGYVLAEALMCEVPVITMLTPFNDNAQFEVVGHNHGGICATNTNEFVSAVMQLYHSNEDCERFKKNLGNHWIEKRFGAAAVIPMQVEYFSQLAQGQKIEKRDVNTIIKNCFTMYGSAKYFMYMGLKMLNNRSSLLFLKKIKKLLR